MSSPTDSRPVVIVDYGCGNLASIRNMLARCGAEGWITSCVETIERADKLILPGVGAFDHGVRSLRERGLVEPLERRVRRDGVPVLGICLGMQLLGEGSEEGELSGLGWLAARSVRFRFEPGRRSPRIPHMGWSDVESARASPLLEDLPDPPRFYFVHSYHVVCRDEEDVLARSLHGAPFTAAVERDNILGVQFHPEKSHKYGMRLLRNFVENY